MAKLGAPGLMTDRFSADDLSRRSSAAPRAIDLAHAAPFRLGDTQVYPASRELVRGARRELAEPLVMQVLVALHSVNGATLSRDDLIDACWGGRAVSDDAISRVVSRLRGLGKSLGGFTVETMPKIGYRLIVDGAAAPPGEADRRLGRRALLTRTIAAGVAAAGVIVLWREPWRNRPVPEAEQLYLRGQSLTREGLPGQVRQSVTYFERAVAVDPDYADAWGALALGYTHLLQGFDEGETASLPRRVRSAASRALALDPDNADAALALIFLTPFYGAWQAKEVALRKVISRHPRHWLAQGRLAMLMYEVGRLAEGIAHHQSALRIEPTLPIAYRAIIANSSALGRVHEAEAMIEQAAKRWPAHPALWSTTFNHYLASGRYRAAKAFLADEERRPVGFGAPPIEHRQVLLRAVETGDPAAIAESLAHHRRMAVEDSVAIEIAAPVFALLGQIDLALASLERYFFGRGPFPANAVPGRFTRRGTAFLFESALAPARADPRFAALLRDIGLEDYWRRTGTAPGFRRA